MDTNEKEPTAVVELIAPNGLGFGEGNISVEDQIDQGIITPEAPVRIHEVLVHDSRAFKKIEADDDGCGDGRPWCKIMQLLDEAGEKKVKFHKTSLLRAKVFGGGLVASASMWRVIQGKPEAGQSVGQDRAVMARALSEREFSHGAHSDDHATGENCGCGAIDKYPIITANALKYREKITDTLRALYGDEFEKNRSSIDQVFEVYGELANDDEYFRDGNGKQSIEQIIDAGAVVKELAGNHVEETIVINDIPGTTLDQRYVTETVKNACVEDVKPQTIQAFSVDVWRGRDIAAVVAEVAKENDPSCDEESVRALAYADFLVRTLAVAATLTAGDLPVYRRRVAQAEA